MAGAGSFLYAASHSLLALANVKAAPASQAYMCVASGWPLVQVESWLRVSCGSIHPSKAQLSTGDPGGFSADEVGLGSTAAQLCPPEHHPRAGKRGLGGLPHSHLS